MSWPHQPEVTPVQRREFRLLPALDHREHCRIDKADIRVGVLIAEFSHADEVECVEIFDYVCPREHIIQQLREDPRMEAGLDQPVEFDQNGRWNDE